MRAGVKSEQNAKRWDGAARQMMEGSRMRPELVGEVKVKSEEDH